MKPIMGFIDSISEWSGKILMPLIPISGAILLIEVALRYIFKAPTIWAHQISVQLFGAYSVLAGAYVLLHSAHVKVDVIYEHFPVRTRAVIDLITYLFFFYFVSLMLIFGLQTALHSIQIRETDTPPFQVILYPLRCAIPLAAALILLQGLAKWIRTLYVAIKGRQLE